MGIERGQIQLIACASLNKVQTLDSFLVSTAARVERKMRGLGLMRNLPHKAVKEDLLCCSHRNDTSCRTRYSVNGRVVHDSVEIERGP